MAPEIPAEVYEVAGARLAVSDALAPLVLLHQMDYEPAYRQIRAAATAMVDAVWPLAYAAGRRSMLDDPEVAAVLDDTVTAFEQHRDEARQVPDGD
jgi:hypothetical protein